MTSELTITTKGQITLETSVLTHLGARPGHKLHLSLLPNGRVELAVPTKRDVSSVQGLLKREGQRVVSIEEMQDAIEAAACGEPLKDLPPPPGPGSG